MKLSLVPFGIELDEKEMSFSIFERTSKSIAKATMNSIFEKF